VLLAATGLFGEELSFTLNLGLSQGIRVEEATLTIGKLAAAAGVNASAVRYYERRGLMPEPERVGGQRRYGPDAVARLRTIRASQQAGLSLEEIAQLLAGADDGESAETLRALAERKLPDVEALIDRAEAMKGWLELAAECRCGSLDVCDLFASDAPDSVRVGNGSQQ
jgi:MerR family transcriptional regulator, redox-sensitive transcriptional activator SoxR